MFLIKWLWNDLMNIRSYQALCISNSVALFELVSFREHERPPRGKMFTKARRDLLCNFMKRKYRFQKRFCESDVVRYSLEGDFVMLMAIIFCLDITETIGIRPSYELVQKKIKRQIK